jgi:hypothetical protein
MTAGSSTWASPYEEERQPTTRRRLERRVVQGCWRSFPTADQSKQLGREGPPSEARQVSWTPSHGGEQAPRGPRRARLSGLGGSRPSGGGRASGRLHKGQCVLPQLRSHPLAFVLNKGLILCEPPPVFHHIHSPSKPQGQSARKRPDLRLSAGQRLELGGQKLARLRPSVQRNSG